MKPKRYYQEIKKHPYPLSFLIDCGVYLKEKNLTEEQLSLLEKYIKSTVLKTYSDKKMKILKERYTNFTPVRTIGEQYHLSGERINKIILQSRKEMIKHKFFQCFIRFLYRNGFELENMDDFPEQIKTFWNKENLYQNYSSISLQELDISERLLRILYHAGFMNVADILTENLSVLQKQKFFDNERIFELFAGIAEVQRHEIPTKVIQNAPYPNNFLMDCGMGGITGTFQESSVKQIEEIIKTHLCYRNHETNLLILKYHYENKLEKNVIIQLLSITSRQYDRILHAMRKQFQNLMYRSELRQLFVKESQAGVHFDGIVIQKFLHLDESSIHDNLSINQMPIADRTKRILNENGYQTIDDLINGNPMKIKSIESLHEKSYRRLAEVMIKQYQADPNNWLFWEQK